MQPADRVAADAAFDLFCKGLGGDREALGRFVACFHEDAVLYFPPTPRTHSPYTGRAAIYDFFFGIVVKAFPTGLAITPRYRLEDERRVAYQFADTGTMADGRAYANSVCVTFEMRDGRIARYWEFFGGPGYYDES